MSDAQHQAKMDRFSADAEDAEQEQREAAKRYLIWSRGHRAWWGPGHAGYTPDIDRAGRYTTLEAASITMDVIPPGTEVAVPEDIAHRALALLSA